MLASHPTTPIIAIATAPGRGAVGIVRVSGWGVAPLARALTAHAVDGTPRRAHFGAWPDADGQAIDQGLTLFFPAPHSYTGEDVLELQAHGGPVVLQLLVARCLALAAEVDGVTHQPRLPGLRLAEPGEFTQRAFLNDKLDLAQAEAVADLIDASTEAAARSASRSLAGALSARVEALRDPLIELRMLVEATLDFPEEEIDFLEKARARERLQTIAVALDALLMQAKQGALLREGLQVVLAGQPNAGKSSLLNALAGAELAIVTPIAGTTRDKVSETIQIEGVPLKVIGMSRSWEAIAQADAVLFLHDLTRMGEPSYQQADAAIGARLAEALGGGVPVLHVFNKADTGTYSMDAEGRREGVPEEMRAKMPEGPSLHLSALTGEGLPALRQHLLAQAGWQPSNEGAFMARQRHVQAMQQAREHLHMAQQHVAHNDQSLDLLAEELRLAHEALGSIVGAFTPDDLLGEIFGRFCIGK
jgi:tRNA modification GTPase